TRWYGLDRECQAQKQIAAVYGVAGPAVGQTERAAKQKLAAYLAVPYGMLRGQALESETYTSDQAAAALGISRRAFYWLVRKGKISRQPNERGPRARYARCEVEQLATD